MTALEKFLNEIVLTKKGGSVYLVPAICDFQIEEVLEEERKQILKHQIFIGKVAGIIGFENTVKLLKESDINFKEQSEQKKDNSINQIENIMERWHHGRSEDVEALDAISKILSDSGRLSFFGNKD